MLLELTNIQKSFGRTRALAGVSLRASAGVHAVLGENGAGKSTLMKILAGAIAPDGGEMRLREKLYAPRDPAEGRAAGVAIVYQEPQLCPDLTVAENIALGSEPTRFGFVDRGRVRARAEEALAQLSEERIATDRLVASLPAGDRQLVAIARAISQARCRVLILDEPTSSLGAHDVDRLFAAVRRLRESGMCILYISHFLEEVERIADRYTVLRDGKSVGTGKVGEQPMREIVRMMVGQDVGELFAHSERELGDVVLSLEDLAGKTKPTHASLELYRGEVLGIAGLVGSGRTELLRAVFGLDPVKSGRVRVGAYVGPASPARRLTQGLGLLSEDRKGEGLAAGMSIADNLTLSKLAGLGPPGLVLNAPQRAAAQSWIQRLSIRCRDAAQPVSDLSGGNQQKVALARLLYHDVDVFLLDEPTRGIDVKSRAEVYRLIDELAVQGKAVLVVSSYLPELVGICDRIAVMRKGRLGEARPVGERDMHALLVEATGA
ncbi:MAG TPA: sugar ABC transporter ATP-binding protein [Polyangiaceae bacterium]|jgi:ribose transport system ATP-binding protein|nr:sugar ABC transporter ATP-binding protein [Polyangiaceae bacterium]